MTPGSPAITRHFVLPKNGPYLLSHSVGPLPVAARDKIEALYFAPWGQSGGGAWDEWLEAVEGFRSRLSRLIGCAPETICPQPNLSAGLAKLLSGIASNPDRPVLLLAEESFPSLGFVADKAQRLGYRLRFLPRGAALQNIETWDEALSNDVGTVLVTHLHSNNGVISPVEEITKICRARGVRSIIDIAQSLGQIPVDLVAWQANAVLGSCVKWSCGGPGAGFLAVHQDEIAQYDPADTGWFSHANPFEFDIHNFHPAPDARRFWGGTPSIASYIIAQAGLELIDSITVPTIRAHARALQTIILGQEPAAWLGGTLCLDAGAKAPNIREELDKNGVYHDWRGSTLRLSFHAFNTTDDALRVKSIIYRLML